ncbi:MAG TPA: sugar ABC transporter substrate-binding protein [Gaiellales bacterium]|jgi:sorbitol/mannitol transport system substrate-binding protein|nr:sugar ABC transporter substrate-binding protein [Gaiellales bacterium]
MGRKRAGAPRRRITFLALAAAAALVAATAALPGAAFGRSQGKTISVAIVKNPQMTDIASLTPSLFTSKSGIKVKYTILDEGKLREITTRDVGSGGKSFDVVMIGMYETPQFGQAGLLENLTPMAKSDAAYKFNDVLPAVRNGLSANGKLYASPFYAESSFLMYRKDVLKAAGATMPANPTWDQVAAIARKVNTPNMAGICLRGKPGWGDLGASFTTVLNTFGGTWWSSTASGKPAAAQVNQPAFKTALDFYSKLVQDAGEKDAANSSFNECLAQYQAGKVAMWYDATVAAGLLEAADSPVKGKNGYALAPVDKTKASGWLWSWALAIPKSSPDPTDAWKYISWATGPGYIKAAGTKTKGGWASIPPGTRTSTYQIPQYKKAAAAFAAKTLAAMKAAPITNPGTTKRPGLPGVQYVGIPQFQDVGNQCTQLFSSVIAGSTSDSDAISQCQQIASQAIK